MSFMEHPQPDACRALMPTPEPPPPGPPSRPMVCHMPKGHDGPHAITRHPRTLDRRWEGDARPPATPPVPVTAVDVDALDKLREAAGFEGWTYDPGSPRVVRDGHPRLPAALITFRDPEADAALIVAAVNALPDLLAEVRRGRALREAVVGLAEAIADEAVDAIWHRDCLRDSAARLRAVVATVDGGEQQ